MGQPQSQPLPESIGHVVKIPGSALADPPAEVSGTWTVAHQQDKDGYSLSKVVLHPPSFQDLPTFLYLKKDEYLKKIVGMVHFCVINYLVHSQFLNRVTWIKSRNRFCQGHGTLL